MGRAGLVGWEGGVNRVDGSLIAVVLLHLAITIVHGQAHSGAAIPLPLAATLFVYLVILAVRSSASRSHAGVRLPARGWSPRRSAARLSSVSSITSSSPGRITSTTSHRRGARNSASPRCCSSPAKPLASSSACDPRFDESPGGHHERLHRRRIRSHRLPLVRKLVAAGHQVTALTRSAVESRDAARARRHAGRRRRARRRRRCAALSSPRTRRTSSTS